MHNDRPTHFDVVHNSSSLIDYFLVNDVNNVAFHDQFWIPGISRHAFILLSLDVPLRHVNREIFYRDYKNIDVDGLLLSASRINFSSFYSTNDVDEQLNFLSNAIMQLFNSFVIVKRFVPRSISDVLTSPRIMAAKNLRDLAFKAYCENRVNSGNRTGERWATFTRYRNRVKAEIRKAKRDVGINSFGEDLSSKQLWRKLNNVGATNSDDDYIDDDVDPDILNNCFVSAQTGNVQPRFDFDIPEHPNAIAFRNVFPDEVVSAFAQIKSNAVGVDEIPLKFLKILMPALLPQFVFLFNTVFTSSKFPAAWKVAKV